MDVRVTMDDSETKIISEAQSAPEIENRHETMIAPVGDPLIGTILGDCKLVEQIGKGGMGAVYKAHHLKLEKTVAVKILTATPGAADPMIIERFVREARLAACIEHENIVNILNVGCEHNTHYIIQQFLEGEPISDLLERKKTTLARSDWNYYGRGARFGRSPPS